MLCNAYATGRGHKASISRENAGCTRAPGVRRLLGLHKLWVCSLKCAGIGLVPELEKSQVAVAKGKRTGKGPRTRALVTVYTNLAYLEGVFSPLSKNQVSKHES